MHTGERWGGGGGGPGADNTRTRRQKRGEAVSGCCCVVVAKYHAHSPAVSLSLSFSFWGDLDRFFFAGRPEKEMPLNSPVHCNEMEMDTKCLIENLSSLNIVHKSCRD